MLRHKTSLHIMEDILRDNIGRLGTAGTGRGFIGLGSLADSAARTILGAVCVDSTRDKYPSGLMGFTSKVMPCLSTVLHISPKS